MPAGENITERTKMTKRMRKERTRERICQKTKKSKALSLGPEEKHPIIPSPLINEPIINL